MNNPAGGEKFLSLFWMFQKMTPAGGGKNLAISTDLQSGMLSGNSESHLRSQNFSRAYRREDPAPPKTPQKIDFFGRWKIRLLVTGHLDPPPMVPPLKSPIYLITLKIAFR